MTQQGAAAACTSLRAWRQWGTTAAGAASLATLGDTSPWTARRSGERQLEWGGGWRGRLGTWGWGRSGVFCVILLRRKTLRRFFYALRVLELYPRSMCIYVHIYISYICVYIFVLCFLFWINFLIDWLLQDCLFRTLSSILCVYFLDMILRYKTAYFVIHLRNPFDCESNGIPFGS